MIPLAPRVWLAAGSHRHAQGLRRLWREPREVGVLSCVGPGGSCDQAAFRGESGLGCFVRHGLIDALTPSENIDYFGFVLPK
jgi:hypothetical protein